MYKLGCMSQDFCSAVKLSSENPSFMKDRDEGINLHMLSLYLFGCSAISVNA
jgi:hypothetical protein